MIKVKILKAGQDYAGARFPTQAEADAWIADNVANNSWGFPERWIKQSEIPLLGLNEADAVAQEERETPLGAAMFYKFAADYVIEQSDASAEYADELAEQESAEAFQLATQVKIKIRALNIKKLKGGIWNAAKWNQYKNDATLKQIQAAIDTASFNEAQALVQSMNEDFYSADEKGKILSLINAHLTKWG